MSITFRELHIENSGRCRNDNVTLYDGRDTHAPLIGRYCGSRAPQPVTSSSSAVFVVFASDIDYNAGRFALSWKLNEGQSSWCNFMDVLTTEDTHIPTCSEYRKQVYRRRYESSRSSKPKLHCKKYGEKRFLICHMEFLHPAMWHVALESWQWIHQVPAPCNVTRSCGMTCHSIPSNVRHIGILHLVSFSTHHRSRHVILYQSAKFYSNQTTFGRKKWRHVDFQDGGSQPCWIVGIR